MLNPKKDFVWGLVHTTAIESAKQLLVNLPTLKFFKPIKLTRLLFNAGNKDLFCSSNRGRNCSCLGWILFFELPRIPVHHCVNGNARSHVGGH